MMKHSSLAIGIIPPGFAVVPLSVIHYPHPTLRHKSQPLRRVDAPLRGMVAEMIELMYKHEGVGLAANQVDLPYRLFVMNPTGDANDRGEERVFINPVLSRGKGSAVREEGCLSLPGLHADVTRHASVRIEGYDLSGNNVVLDLEGFPARIVQHEVDHLDGVMFIDRLSPTQKADVQYLIDEFDIAWLSRLATGEVPTPEQVAARIVELQSLRT